MLIQPDLAVVDTLEAALAALRADPTEIHEIFRGRPADERSEITGFFGSTEVPVRLGWPAGAAELPGLFVTIGGATEADRFVGSALADSDEGSTIVEEYGSTFQGPVRVACWSRNGRLTVYLATVAQWALQKGRQQLEEQDGLAEQTITLTDFEPIPQWFPDFVFRRDLVLAAKWFGTFRVTVPKVAKVAVAATATPYVQPAAVAVLSRR